MHCTRRACDSDASTPPSPDVLCTVTCAPPHVTTGAPHVTTGAEVEVETSGREHVSACWQVVLNA